jgi:hypothetical protein
MTREPDPVSRPAKRTGGFWPSEDQERLLGAALRSGAEAVDAWRALRPRLRLDRLDAGSARLLPLLYANLLRHGIDDPQLGALRALYRRTWSENQVLFHHASRLLLTLRDARIDTMVLKGLALTCQYYRDPGLRPMADIDILVPSAMATRAIDLLRRCGWSPRYAMSPSFLEIKHACPFEDSGGRCCDLHWRVFEEWCPATADDELWASSVEIDLPGTRTRALSPADQLLHVCAHGAKWSSTSGIRWVADATLIIRAGGVDWGRLVSQAAERRFTLRLRETLDYLRRVVDAPVPDEALARLARLPVSPLERFEYRLRSRQRRLLGELPVYWCNYLRSTQGLQRMDLPRFLRYLRHAWGLESVAQVPRGALLRMTRRLRRRLPGWAAHLPLQIVVVLQLS